MSITSYGTFCLLVFTIVFSPGPMTMFLMTNGMRSHHRNIWPILMGANHAYLLSIIIFTVGLTQLLQQNIYLLKAVQLAGVFYLVYLAYVQWNKKLISTADAAKVDISQDTSALYMRGALIALSNPKTILLFSIIFPQFIDEGSNRLIQIFILGATFLLLQFSSGCTYAYFGRRLKKLIERPNYQTLINKLSAVILLVIAGFLLTSS